MTNRHFFISYVAKTTYGLTFASMSINTKGEYANLKKLVAQLKQDSPSFEWVTILGVTELSNNDLQELLADDK